MAIFRLRANKYPPGHYDAWLETAMSVEDCMVVFTDPASQESLQSFRKDRMQRTVFITMNITDLPIVKLHQKSTVQQPFEFWDLQLRQDPQKKMHKGYQLFWIWLSKTWFVNQAVTHNWFKSDLFVYVDMGSFRSRQGQRFANKTIVQHRDVLPTDRIAWLAHHEPRAPPTALFTDIFRHPEYFFHSGSLASGYRDTWLKYHEKFALMVDRFLAVGLFIGEDQSVLQGTCQAYPHLCVYIPRNQVRGDSHYFGIRSVLHRGGKYKFWYMPTDGSALPEERTAW